MDVPQEEFEQFIQHVDKLLNSPGTTALPEKWQNNEAILKLHERMMQLRGALVKFSEGNVSEPISFRGYAGGCLKGLQAHLQHFIWQVQQVEKGDFTQRIDFLGEFSTHFNNMIEQLDFTMNALKQKEEALLALTKSLQEEVELRKSAMTALSKSEAQFRYLAEHDPLTGCLNRRSFFGNAVPALRAAMYNDQPTCIALLDIDFFKRINDTYGHQEGDQALQFVVNLAKKSLRGGDMLGRYGGEEFIFFFAAADLEKGEHALNRIRNLIKSTPLVLGDGVTTVTLTVSCGVSVVLPDWPGDRTQAYIERVVKFADMALYRAKQEGRDRVLCDGFGVTAPPVFDEEGLPASPQGSSAA